MIHLFQKHPLTVLPVSVFAAVAGSKGLGSEWLFGDLAMFDWLLVLVGTIGIVGSVLVLSKRNP